MSSLRIATDLAWLMCIALACAFLALGIFNAVRRLWFEYRHRLTRRPEALRRPDMVLLWNHSPLKGDPGLPSDVLCIRCERDVHNLAQAPITYAVAIRGDGPLHIWLALTWELRQIRKTRQGTLRPQLETVHR